MTTLVGIAGPSRVWIGADSRITWGGLAQTCLEPKVWRRGRVLMAHTGETRGADLLRTADLPRFGGGDPSAWLRLTLVPAMREVYTSGGFRQAETTGEEAGPELLIGLAGRLWSVSGSWSVCEHVEFARGSGHEFALGSLATSARLWSLPRRRIQEALEVAASLDICTAGPFTVMKDRG